MPRKCAICGQADDGTKEGSVARYATYVTIPKDREPFYVNDVLLHSHESRMCTMEYHNRNPQIEQMSMYYDDVHRKFPSTNGV